MKKCIVIKMGFLLLTIVMVSGCILVPVEDGRYYEGSHRRGHSNNYEDRGDRH